MHNPFDDDTAQFYVLVNEEGEHSMWPVFASVPTGWHIAYGPAGRAAGLAYVEAHWLDMRPASLIAAMETESSR
ncbi:MbtH family protein [Nocardia arizonensis]|uniref:MbtH family protein n=1 Tax=Nocardia arizonensis TaxID=1141647 RepID=UPI0006D0DAC8|nr:MbtH family NRPS accessory protein [Nocardia arizonensis]